jgi:hypothetical protein
MTTGRPAPAQTRVFAGARSARWSGRLAAAAGLFGTVLVVAGTFLPWVVSGGRTRNVYELVGVAGKLGLLGPRAGSRGPRPPSACWARRASCRWSSRWPGCADRRGGGGPRRPARRGVPAAAALALGDRASGAGIRLEPSGPAAVLAGAVLLVSAGVVAVVGRIRAGRRTAATAGPRVGWSHHSPGTGPTNGHGSATASVTLDTAPATSGLPSTAEVRHRGRDADRRGEQ